MAKKSKVKSKAKRKSSKAKSRKRKQKVHKPALRAKPKKAKLKARRAKPKAPLVVGTIDEIIQIAAKSPIAKYKWKDRGRAPRGYTKGMALTFARVYCKWKAGDPCRRS